MNGAARVNTIGPVSAPRWRMPSPALLFLMVLIGGAAIAPLVAPYAPDALDLANRRGTPSGAHWFGTDELGRDVLTRVLTGARVSLAIGLLSALTSALVGTLVGSVAGMRGRWLDEVLMRITDAMLCVPRLPLLMLAAAVLQPNVPTLVLLVGLTGWMETARVIRAETRSIMAREFVQAAQAIGASAPRVLVRHVLPAVVPTLTVATTLAIGRAILLESTMSFFGVGVQPPTASWGNMLYQAQSTMSTEPWLAIFPGLFIFLTVLACNTVGDSLGRVPSRSLR